MTGCQEYLLKIKLGEIASGERTSGKQKEEMLKELSFGPETANRARLQHTFARLADGALNGTTLTEICFHPDMIIVQ